MRWCVIRHPQIGLAAIVAEPAVEIHQSAGWIRVSPLVDDQQSLHVDEYADATADLDAPPAPEVAPAASPTKIAKEPQP